MVFTMIFTLSVSVNASARTMINDTSDIVGGITNISNNINALNEKLSQINAQTEKKLKKKTEKKTKKLSKVEKYRENLFDLGVVDLSESEDDCIKIYKDCSRKSKVMGYLTDGAVLRVIEQNEKWYKIKSGEIKGYISTKNIVVDDDVETLLLENGSIEAKFVQDNVEIMSKAKGSDVAVGMGYIDRSYPVAGFSNSGKYVRIQRTENIAGWVSISDVDIKITAQKAMTKAEYKEYEEEQQLLQQEQLESILNPGVPSTGDELMDNIISLLAQNESGNYMAARNGLAQYRSEKTITVGAWQWYGERAHNLLRNICLRDSKKAKEIINNSFTGKKEKQRAEKLYSDIVGNENWESSARIFSKEELIAVKTLLGSEIGVEIQNAQVKSDVAARINVAKDEYKLTNNRLIAYFCDLFWQNPENARLITTQCIKHFKTAEKFNEAKDALKYMHETTMKNGVMGAFTKRRVYTYSFCRNLSK